MKTRTDAVRETGIEGVDRRRLLMGGLLASGCLLAHPAELFAQGNTFPALSLNLGTMHDQVEIPASIAPAQLKRDCEKMLALLQKSPNEVQQIVAKVRSGDQAGARKVVEQIGLTEEAFTAQGGGLWHLLIILAAAYLLHKYGPK